MTRAAAIAVLVMLACAPPRPPLPRIDQGALARDVERVDLLAARLMADADLHAQATAYVLGKVQRDRERAARTFRVARRSP